ncbi:MAG: hypothetical protein V4523_14305 [Pseudomonadota bacterium]
MPIIKIIRDYSGQEGIGPDKDVLTGTMHSVTRARAAELKANRLVEIVSDEPHAEDEVDTELRTDGPTVGEYVAAGYFASAYPPVGYASRSTADEISAAIADQASVNPQEEQPVPEEKSIPPITNKAAAEPKNKAAPKAENKKPAQAD